MLSKSDARRLLWFSIFRVLTNTLDIIGIAGVAMLASAFSSLSGSSSQGFAVGLPLDFSLALTEGSAVLLALMITLVFIAKSSITVLLNLKTSLFIADIETRFSNQLVRQFFASGVSYFDNASVSNFQNVVTASTGGIKQFLNARILFISEGSLLLGLLLVFVIVNPIATVAISALMGMVLVIFNGVINTGLRRNGHEQIDASQKSLQAIRNLHSIHREARAAGVVDEWLKLFSDNRSKMAAAGAKLYTLNSLPRFVIETSLILAFFLFLGGIVIFSDIPSQAVTIGVFLAGGLRIMASVIPFQAAVSGMRTGAALGERAFLELQKISRSEIGEPSTVPSDSDLAGALKFDNVSFSYEEKSPEIIKKVSFEVQEKTKYAVVGPSGSGKTTLFALAMGFLTPDHGQVLLGNKNSRDVLLASQGYLAFVPQSPQLVTGTLATNVSLRGDQDNERIKEVLIRCGLEELTLAKNWAITQINPDSSPLSGGQVQRLSLARAIYRKPKILFLDEATSALDAKTENSITKLLDELAKEMTVVMIAHRLSTIRSADKILYLKNGQVLAEGTFNHLKKNVPDFASAVKLLDMGS